MTDPQPYNPLAIENLAASIITTMELSPPTPLASLSRFLGAGLYALYYSGEDPLYAPIAHTDPEAPWSEPIYVGKATPSGGRKGLTASKLEPNVFSRLSEHRRSIESAVNLDIDGFAARWIVVDEIWIPLGESVLLRRHQPVWNAVVDGFGNHDPGAGRRRGVRSRWDTLHPGRPFAQLFPERNETQDDIRQDVEEYLRSRLA